jgi:hypothetical protein
VLYTHIHVVPSLRMCVELYLHSFVCTCGMVLNLGQMNSLPGTTCGCKNFKVTMVGFSKKYFHFWELSFQPYLLIIAKDMTHVKTSLKSYFSVPHTWRVCWSQLITSSGLCGLVLLHMDSFNGEEWAVIFTWNRKESCYNTDFLGSFLHLFLSERNFQD